jgi:hypothetical protein
MFCCVQALAVVELNRNTDASEVFREQRTVLRDKETKGSRGSRAGKGGTMESRNLATEARGGPSVSPASQAFWFSLDRRQRTNARPMWPHLRAAELLKRTKAAPPEGSEASKTSTQTS